MGDSKLIEPIAYIKTDFSEKFGIPRQSGRVKSLTGKIIFNSKYRDEEALRCLEGFSHVWLIFGFSQSDNKKFVPTVRPPKLGGNLKVGVFASRSPFRPNGIGISAVKILETKKNTNDGPVIIVAGVDLLNNTPIYDIKPYLPSSDSIADAIGGYSTDLESNKLNVDFPCDLLKKLPEDKRTTVVECLAEDPRPGYHSDNQRVYNMIFSEYNIKFVVEDSVLKVISVDNL